MYEIIITDASGTITLPQLEIPLSLAILEGASDVQTLDYNVYTDFITTKRLVSHTWSYLSKADFTALKGYYDRQFTMFAYPTITITEMGITDMIVRMILSPQSVSDQCGTVEGVTVSFRESKVNP